MDIPPCDGIYTDTITNKDSFLARFRIPLTARSGANKAVLTVGIERE